MIFCVHILYSIFDSDDSMSVVHGKVWALHLVNLLKSSRRFINLMKGYNNPECINCLKSIHLQLQKNVGHFVGTIIYMHASTSGTTLLLLPSSWS